MILLLSVLFGLIAVSIRSRLTGRPLRIPELRLTGLVFLAVIPQVLVFQIPSIGSLIPTEYIPYILVTTQMILLVFTAANIRSPGFWALGLGLLLNFMVILLNGGWMPVSPQTLQRMYPHLPLDHWQVGERFALSKDRILDASHTRTVFLSDWMTLPLWIPYRVAFSPGDILISIGAVSLMWSLCSENHEVKNEHDPEQEPFDPAAGIPG